MIKSLEECLKILHPLLHQLLCKDEEVLCFLPSDHIQNNRKFINVLSKANKIALDDVLKVIGLKARSPM